MENKRAVLICALLFVIIFNFTNSEISNCIVSVAAYAPIDIIKNKITNNDLFADYIKIILSYPGASNAKIDNMWGLKLLFENYKSHNPYEGISGLRFEDHITHFHNTPVAVLFYLISLRLAHFISPLIIYIVLYLCLLYFIYKSINLFSDNICRISAFLIIIFSYPFYLSFERGNICAALCGILIIKYLISIINDSNLKHYVLLMISIAINIRPNAGIFIFALLGIYNLRNTMRNVIYIFIYSSLIFTICYYIDNHLYSQYSINNIILGLRNYFNIYVIGGGGAESSSSMFSMIYPFLGYSKRILNLAELIPFTLFIASTLLRYNKHLDYKNYILCLCISYSLLSTIFANYHLLCFLAPLLLFIHEISLNGYTINNFLKSNLFILLILLMLLIGKTFYFIHGYSLEVFVNPVLELILFLYLIIKAVFKFRITIKFTN